MRDSKKRGNPRKRRVSAAEAVHNPVQSAPGHSIWQIQNCPKLSRRGLACLKQIATEFWG
jgi:hypothetical protein